MGWKSFVGVNDLHANRGSGNEPVMSVNANVDYCYLDLGGKHSNLRMQFIFSLVQLSETN